MTSAVGVLCARKRIEEKQIVQALVDAGVPALPVSPADLPLPIAPHPSAPPVAAAFGMHLGVVIDRCQDRTVASAILPVWRSTGATTLDAGLAATGTRLSVASTLAACGIPRPATYLVASETAGLAAVAAVGYPATLLPATPGAREIALLDHDTAEAVFEHRDTLGGASANVSLVQAGVSFGGARVTVIVVDGQAVAIDDPAGVAVFPARFVALAEATAHALGATIVGVVLVPAAHGPVVWDVDPTPDFRDATPLGHVGVAEAIACLAITRLPKEATIVPITRDGLDLGVALVREAADGVALTA